MKISIKIAAVALMLGFAFQANAQETAGATATASATIIAPIQIAKNVDMNFGDIIATTSGGTVVLAVDGGRTPVGVQISTAGAVGAAAQFTVTGTGTYTYDINLPANGYEITTGTGLAGEVMTIGTWIHNAGVAPALVAGSNIFNVGATLGVVANQVAGEYTNATPFTVSVNYN